MQIYSSITIIVTCIVLTPMRLWLLIVITDVYTNVAKLPNQDAAYTSMETRLYYLNFV